MSSRDETATPTAGPSAQRVQWTREYETEPTAGKWLFGHAPTIPMCPHLPYVIHMRVAFHTLDMAGGPCRPDDIKLAMVEGNDPYQGIQVFNETQRSDFGNVPGDCSWDTLGLAGGSKVPTYHTRGGSMGPAQPQWAGLLISSFSGFRPVRVTVYTTLVLMTGASP